MGITSGTGRNTWGGFDIQATIRHGLSEALLLAQIKQYRRPIPRSFVDELRGTLLRLGAHQGLLITTASFSQSAQKAAASANHPLPVTLVGGEELVDLLIAHGVTIANRKHGAIDRQRAVSKLEPQEPPETPEMPPPQSEVKITLTVGIPDPLPEEKRKHHHK